MTIDAALLQMKKADRIALIAHIQPDGDTIGSCLALADIIKDAGKSVDLYCQDKVPASLEFLNGWEQFQSQAEHCMPYDLAIAIDCSDEERMGSCLAAFKAGRQTMNIDHHISNTSYADFNLVDTKAAATGEIIFHIGKAMAHRFGMHTAEALYTAISTDTGRFSFRNTTSKSYRIAAELLDCGIDVELITSLLFKTNRKERIRLLSLALRSLSLYENNQIAIMTITQNDLAASGAWESETENMVNYAKDITGVKLGILLKESIDGSVKVSFRSGGEIDVSKLAGQFGGGGHKAASGATLHVDICKAREIILTASREILGAAFK